MQILYKSYHAIKISDGCIERKAIVGDFDNIISNMLRELIGNPSAKRYRRESESSSVPCIVENILKIDSTEENSEEIFAGFSDLIADRLLQKEKRVDERMSKLHGVQRGSLIQALVKNDGDENCKYLIAKVEHKNFVEEEELLVKGGFDPEENKIWKTCIFICDEDDGKYVVDEARIFLNNSAVYWTRDFLELEEMRSDEMNTKDAWRGIEAILSNKLKKNATSDYFVLRSSVISYLRRPNMINYPQMIEDIFGDFVPRDATEEKINEIKKALHKLPEDKKFDTSFRSVPKAVHARVKSVHKVNNDVDIIIREGLSGDSKEYQNIISVDKEDSGISFLKIKLTDEETLRMFDLKRE